MNRLTRSQIKNVELGSKMQLLAWYTYVTLIWALKGCMLFFFSRLSFGLTREKFVKALVLCCVATYLAMFFTITFSCYPIRMHWQVTPKPPLRCTLRIQNFYVCTILNVITDAALLAVPIPMLWKLRVPLRKKITLACLLSSGIFIITAAIVRIVMSLQGNPNALTINRWGVRETIAGIIAVNAPMLAPLATRSFYSRGSKVSGPKPEPRDQDQTGNSTEKGSAATGRKSKIGSSVSWADRQPEAMEMASKHGKETNIGFPPHLFSRDAAILTPWSAELREIERIDPHLDNHSDRHSTIQEDKAFERGDYFNCIDITERGPGPPPVPIEIIDAQPLYIPPAPGSLVRHESPEPTSGQLTECGQHARWAKRWHTFTRGRHSAA